MSGFGERFTAFYRKKIFSFLQIPDEELSPVAARNLQSAAELDIVDLGGVIGVKTEAKTKEYFLKNRIPILRKKLLTSSGIALYHTIKNPYRVDVKDSDLDFLLNQSYFGRMMRPCSVDSKDEYVIDTSHFEGIDTLPGFYHHGIRAFIAREGDLYRLKSLEVSGQNVEKQSKNWELAKIHFLANLDTDFLFADHAVLHITNNIFEAAVKKFVPTDHPLHCFLKPHFGFCIYLDEVILEILHKHTSPGNPVSLPIKSLYRLINRGLEIYQAAGLISQDVPTDYSRKMMEAHEVVQEHVAGFVRKNIQKHDPELTGLKIFADELHKTLKCFPRGADLTPELLIRMVTKFIYEGSFVSSTDHTFTRSELGYFKSIFRVRKPFSLQARWKANELFRPIDLYQRIIFRHIFSGDYCDHLLRDVSYEPSLGVDVKSFRSNLKGLESKHPDIFPLNRVAAFIDI